jgi:hypothetical protein
MGDIIPAEFCDGDWIVPEHQQPVDDKETP